MGEMNLAKAIENGGFLITAECRPPRGTGAAELRACAAALGNSVNAIYAPESEDGVRLCSLAASNHLASAGVEPIMCLLTRDLNRIALQSQILGAASMGLKNLLCLSGRHQALTTSGSAKGVYDVDAIQLISIANAIRKEGKLADGQVIDSPVELTLGTDTNPFADPMELQILTLEKAVMAGADFVMTQPVFNISKFNEWMSAVRDKEIDKRTCIIASVMPVITSQQAALLTDKYRHLSIPGDLLERLRTAGDRRSAGVHVATETAAQLSKIDGVRGIHLMTGDDFELAASIIATSGISRS